MLQILASAVVVLTGIYFIVLGSASFLAPGLAMRFLLGFAASASAHYLELAVRIVVGAALVVASAHMRFGELFLVAGWIVLATTAAMLLVPWRWHRRFAERVVPQALRLLYVLGATAMVLGLLILYSVFAGAA